jgi:hypothetical protein
VRASLRLNRLLLNCPALLASLLDRKVAADWLRWAAAIAFLKTGLLPDGVSSKRRNGFSMLDQALLLVEGAR